VTCLTLGRPSGPAYSTGELLNTPQNDTAGASLQRFYSERYVVHSALTPPLCLSVRDTLELRLNDEEDFAECIYTAR